MHGKGRRNSNPQTRAQLTISAKNFASSSTNPTSNLSLNRAAQSKSRDSKIPSSLKDRIRARNVGNKASNSDKVTEKTLHVVSSPAKPSSHEEGKYASPVKVKFRTGKVVDVQSNNNAPRRLRFRRARIVGAEDIKGDSRRKTSKRDRTIGGKGSTEASPQKVVLKHQDLQGKNDGQGFLNNVIEETASKLAASRKSKVKALVGAFETFISLQEIKPSTQIVNL